MKKRVLMMLLTALAALLVACGGNTKEEAVEKEQPAEVEKDTKEEMVLKEPTADDKCAYCDMVVYAEDDELGMFSVQGVDEKGKTFFFDDIGCLLNYETQEEIELEQYVRDYNSKEWLSFGEVVIVKSAIKTPMNYGFAFFKDEADAEKFISENAELNPEKSNQEAVMAVAQKMHEMKHSGGHGDMDHGEMNHDEHGEMKHEENHN